MKVGILGHGEVGQAIAKFFDKPLIKDKRYSSPEKFSVDILHVCIPYSDDFANIICDEIQFAQPFLTIIHSTVSPFTTRYIRDKTKSAVVHSPIRGCHPDLHREIFIFTKYIGCEEYEEGLLAENHLKSIGLKTKILIPSAVTEFGKLFSTTYYGLCIAFHGEVKKVCDKYGIDFDDVFTEFNKTYNEGNALIGRDNVIRPVLYPPPDNRIGGHCIIPNAEILKKYMYMESEVIDLILKYKS